MNISTPKMPRPPSASVIFFAISCAFAFASALIACGCHVIARYPSGDAGVDARFYEFEKFSPSVETYEAFEAAMDRALYTEVDTAAYAAYLQKHYTSSRVRDLKKLLSQL